MSTQEIIRELAKLSRDELTEVDLRLHELLQENELGITDFLTSDHHFEQAGFRVLLKD